MSPAELVSELTYAGKPLSEIAGYDDRQLQWVIGRKRDKYGRLPKHGQTLDEEGNLGGRERKWDLPGDDYEVTPVTKKVGFKTMYWQTKRSAGLSEEQIVAAWDNYLNSNPKLRAKEGKMLKRMKRGNRRGKHNGPQ